MNVLRIRNPKIRAFRDTWGSLLQFGIGLSLLCIIFVTGLFIFMHVEGWSFIESFYMMVITLTTVGYGEVRPLSETGRLLTAFIVLAGVSTFAYMVGSFSQLLLDGQLRKALWRRKVQKRIEQLNNHFIVCGYGRIGAVVVRELLKEQNDVVVIEHDPQLVETLKHEGIMHLAGDATNDGILVQAGLKRARSIVTALTDEAANVYVTLTARQLNPDISIIARANETSHITRLEFAGANKVVLPHMIGGIRMAHSVLRPTVTDFLDLAIAGNINLQLEQLVITQRSALVGKSLVDSHIRQDFDLIIVAIKRATGELMFNPGPKEMLYAEDTLITLGRTQDLQRICATL